MLPDLESQLAKRRLSVAALAQLIPGPAAEDVLLAVGSLAEGLANDRSDIDLLYIGRRPQLSGTLLEDGALPEVVLRTEHDIEVNVMFLEPPTLAALSDTLEKVFQGVGPTTGEPAFTTLSRNEVLLLHRIRVGVPLFGVPEPVRRRLLVDRLTDYLMLQGRMQHFALREDVLGQLTVGEVESAGFMMFFAMDHVVSLVLASVGETSPDSKWRVRLLRRHQAAIGVATVDGLCRYLTQGVKGELEIQNAIGFCDKVIGDAFNRRQDLVPLLAGLDEAITFVLNPV